MDRFPAGAGRHDTSGAASGTPEPVAVRACPLTCRYVRRFARPAADVFAEVQSPSAKVDHGMATGWWSSLLSWGRPAPQDPLAGALRPADPAP